MTDYLQEQYRASHLSGSNAAYVEESLRSCGWTIRRPFRNTGRRLFSEIADGAGDDTRHLAITEHFRDLGARGH
jgi:2-oxoglutarate dehydrogenase E1 component